MSIIILNELHANLQMKLQQSSLVRRAWSRGPSLAIAAIVHSACVVCLTASASSLENYDFEHALTGWQVNASTLTVEASTNASFNRNSAVRFTGNLPPGSSTNAIRQTVQVRGGDRLQASGFVRSHGLGAPGQIEARLDGPFDSVSNVLWSIGDFGWRRFEIMASTFGLSDGGFETGTLDPWIVAADHAKTTITTNKSHGGGHSLHMQAQWIGWSWNQVYQLLSLKAGDQVQFSGSVLFDILQTTNSWLVAGLKIEPEGGGGGPESVLAAGSIFQPGVWWPRQVTFTAPTNGNYVFRCMLAGGEGGMSEASVYFDDLRLIKIGAPTPPDEFAATLSLGVVGLPGGAPAPVEVFFDSLTLRGSTALPENDDSAFQWLKAQAADLATRPEPIPMPDYPPAYAFGNPGSGTNIAYPAYVEGVFGGYGFRSLTNRQPLRITNTIEIAGFQNYGRADLQFDSYAFMAKNPNTSRGETLLISSNAPYFRIGVDNESSAEFGTGPFPSDHTFFVGSSPLSQFPARLSTAGGQWPRRLNVVFDVPTNHWEAFTNILWNRHALIDSFASDASSSINKAVFVSLAGGTGTSNLLELKTHELHVGAVPFPQSTGHPDYPTTGYAGHNRADLRKPWEFNPVDEADYFLQPAPRGNDVIEPLEIRFFENGQWIPYVYEEYLFNWPNAGTGVRSLFDDDSVLRISGQASYHVDLKVGHKYGKNSFGDDNWPQLGSLRGNGYIRLAGFGGAFAGSFRPIALDPFGLFGNEDFPRMPLVLCRVVPANPDAGLGAIARMFVLAHSKTNQLLASACRFDLHAAPEEVGEQGVFLDAEMHTYLRRPHDPETEGPLGLFTQSSMNWRNGNAIMDSSEAHDIDRIMVFRRDQGEWTSFRTANPSAGVRHQSLGSLRPGDIVYLLQQDRATNSYGYYPEVPYSQASHFVIELFEASLPWGTPPLQMDVFVQNTKSEVNDNVVPTCTVRTNLQQGDHLTSRYRYRLITSPGVEILSPSDPSGDNLWNGSHYPITFTATDDPNHPLLADAYYGSGLEGEWVRLNQTSIPVPTNTHQVTVDWNTSAVQPGAYYVKVTARREDGVGLEGFDVSRTRLQIGSVRFLITTRFLTPPAQSTNGIPIYSPGEVVISEVSVKNLGGAITTGSIRLLHEYAEASRWTDLSDTNRPKESVNCERGDRLDGSPESVLDGIDLPSGATMFLTNRYILPVGRPHGGSFVLRNYPGRAQIHMTFRSGSQVIAEDSRVALYQMTADRRAILTATLADASHLSIGWQTDPGRHYELLAAPAINAPLNCWTNIFSQVAGSNSMSFTDALNQASRFYRVRVLPTPPVQQ